jgi:transcriptional regulator with XRE-family HTH domain
VGESRPHLDKTTLIEANRRFRERLRTARTEADLGQEQVAAALGKPQSFVSKMESGERHLKFVELEEIAELYGKSLDYFRSFRAR